MSDQSRTHDHTHADLTRNQSLVIEALRRTDGPLSAYTILDQLRHDGFRAPLQVYRALEKLIALGLVHRLESLNAFVACRDPGCEGEEAATFMICDTCGQVSEVTDDSLAVQLKQLADGAGFTLRKVAIEMRGVCSVCRPV